MIFVLVYVYFQFRFTFLLQCLFRSEPVDVVVIVWINSSHFQDKRSGYNYNDITFKEVLNFYCLSGGALIIL